jgi:hypothetical protein
MDKILEVFIIVIVGIMVFVLLWDIGEWIIQIIKKLK